MNEKDAPAADLVRRQCKGDSAAANELFARYARRLCGLAEQYIHGRTAGRVDGEDVVQSVFRTFFRRSQRGDFRIDSSAQLWQLLVKITVLKSQAQGRRHTAGLRDARREQSMESKDWSACLSAREPTAEEGAILVEQIEMLLSGMPEKYGHMLELRLQGYSVAETAKQLGLSRMTVYRAMDLMRARLEKKCDDV